MAGEKSKKSRKEVEQELRKTHFMLGTDSKLHYNNK